MRTTRSKKKKAENMKMKINEEGQDAEGDTTEKNVTEVESDSALTNVNHSSNGNGGTDRSDPMSKRQAVGNDDIEEGIKGNTTITSLDKEEDEVDGDSGGEGGGGETAGANIKSTMKQEDDESADDSKSKKENEDEDPVESAKPPAGESKGDGDEGEESKPGVENESGTTNTKDGDEEEIETKEANEDDSKAGTENVKTKGDDGGGPTIDKSDIQGKGDKDDTTMNEPENDKKESGGDNDGDKKDISPPKAKRKVDYDKLYPPDEVALEPCETPIHTPLPNDVLFGRGGLTNHHNGNKRFRQFVAEHKEDYVNATKVVKPRVARHVVKLIRNGNPPGRFLKKRVGYWFDVGDRHAAEKTSQALREKTQDEKRQSKKRQIESLLPGKPQTSPGSTAKRNATAKTDKVTDEMDSTIATPSKSVPALPPPYPPGFVVAPYGYYPVHSYAQGYPPPPLPYYGMHPSPPTPVNAKGEAEKEPNKNGDENSSEEKKSTPSTPGPKNIPSYEALKSSLSSPEPANYPVEGGIFGELDQNGDILVTERDILCGRGGATNHHKGNKRFRDIVALHRADYANAPKVKKPLVARLIVKAIRSSDPPGRFLKSNEAGKWIDVGDKKAAEKSSQALREKPSGLKHKVSQTGEQHPAQPIPSMYMHGYPHGPYPGHLPPMGYYPYPMMPGHPPYTAATQQTPMPPQPPNVSKSPTNKADKEEKEDVGNTKPAENVDSGEKRKSPEVEKENEHASKKQKGAEVTPTKDIEVTVV